MSKETRVSVAVTEEQKEDLDKILRVMKVLGERETDKVSPLIREWIDEFIEEHQDHLDTYESWSEGNPNSAPAMAD